MIQKFIYKEEELPTEIKWQILSFLRMQWPEGFQAENQLRDWIIRPQNHPIHFVLVEKGLVVSYVGVVWKNLAHAGKIYKTYGLSGVFTYPSFRKKGYGLQLVKDAKKYIEKTDADIILFTSVLRGFYEKAGFMHLPKAKILKGCQSSPVEHRESVYMLFLSKKGRAGRKDFETKPVYFGKDTW